MKFRFESSAKEFDIPTDDGRIFSVDEFLTLVNNLFFKDKEPTCSFNVTNLHKQDIIECDVHVPIIKKIYNNLFIQPQKAKMVEKKKVVRVRRWRSRSPVKRRRRWRSRTPPQRFR